MVNLSHPSPANPPEMPAPDPLLLAFDALDLVARCEHTLGELVAVLQGLVPLARRFDPAAASLANVALSMASTRCDSLGSDHAWLVRKIGIYMAGPNIGAGAGTGTGTASSA